MTLYRVLDPPASWPASLPFPGYVTAGGIIGPGEVMDVYLSPEDERDNIAAGLIERVEDA